MKKLLLSLAIVFLTATTPLFSQFRETPAFMVESSAGYAVGVNIDNAALFGARLLYPFERFGLVVEAGGLIAPDNPFFISLLAP